MSDDKSNKWLFNSLTFESSIGLLVILVTGAIALGALAESVEKNTVTVRVLQEQQQRIREDISAIKANQQQQLMYIERILSVIEGKKSS